MLTDSPWAQDFTLQESGIQTRSLGESEDGRQFYIKYQMQFSSALPIRQAQVRQAQITQNYDNLGPENRQQFDQNAHSFLSSKFPDAIIVFVTYETNSQNASRDLDRYWQSQTTDLLKNQVFLRNSRGNRADLAQFSVHPNERSFQFIFPRQINGEPLLGPEDISLMLHFTAPKAGGLGGSNGYLEFKPEKMVFDGNLAY